jgi:glycosyltransferase involved in cell wall biosynthesis
MKSTMKILSVVEATSVNAVAKLVLDFYRTTGELGQSDDDFPAVAGSIVTFDRATTGAGEPNDFIATVRAAGIELDVIPERRRFDLSVIEALKNVTEKRAPDIIVTNSVKSHFIMWRSRLWKKYPWVAFHHGYTATDRKMRLYNRFDRFSLPKADVVVTVCDAFARDLTKVARVPTEKIRVQHNSIRPAPPPAVEDVRAWRERLRVSPDERVLLSIGRLSKEKAHGDLLEAFKHLSEANRDLNVKLLIVGEGPEREKLMAAARSTGISERVVFTGQVKNVQPFYAIADVFVLSSHSEGSPNVLLEAMAANVPVVATAVGGVPEMVKNEESALLVPPMNPAAMAAAVSSLIRNRELAQRLVQNAATLIKVRFHPEQYVRTLVNVYSEVLQAKLPAGSI